MKILFVDGHPVVRHGYASLLDAAIPDLHCHHANSAEDALEQLGQCLPNLVIMEISLDGISGLECCRRMLQRLPQLPVLFFSTHAELSLVRQALDAGARGYISKSADPAVLIEGVRRVLAGQAYVEQELATQLLYSNSQDPHQDSRLDSLSAREHEVFIMQARGLSAASIAEKLCISSKTVANYSTQVKHKLQVSSQAELVHLAIDLGLVRVAQLAG